MKPESPRLEDAYTGRQGNESREEPPRFRQHAFPGAVLHRSVCPLKDMRGSLAYVGWAGFVCIGPIPDQLAVSSSKLFGRFISERRCNSVVDQSARIPDPFWPVP